MTATQGVYYLWRPVFNMLGASTADWMAENMNVTDVAGGFMYRWLFFQATEKDYHLPWPDPKRNNDDLKDHLQQVKQVRGKPHSHSKLGTSSPSGTWLLAQRRTRSAAGLDG